MTLKRVNVFIWTVLVIGWAFDFLFWNKVTGISIPIFLCLLLVAGFFLARQQGLSPAPATLWLLVPIAFFAVMSFVRLEPLTSFLNLGASLALMGLLAHSFLGGKWWLYTFKDYVVGIFQLGIDGLIRPIAVLSNQPKTDDDQKVARKQSLRTSLAVVRGLLLATPVVLIFAAMLSEADPIFGQALEDMLEFLKIENLGELIVRGILISMVAYGILGIFLHAFYKNHDESLSSDETRWIPRFLGFTESAVVLASVNLLFVAFVAVQFQYFFGGQQNIHIDGFTYAEYARRGFGELVAVAFFSLLLFIGLSEITKKTEKNKQSIFSWLGILLVALVSVILVSSFKRLLLYEAAYGFSRLRAYTHAFIIWLGVLLVAAIVLEIIKRQRQFALAAAIAALGFVATLDVINVDGFIVRQNVNRAMKGEILDISYLASLSVDAVPELETLYQQALETGDLAEELHGALACHAVFNDNYQYESDQYRTYGWQSFHLARFRAQQIWNDITGDGDEFDVLYHGDSEYSYNSYVIIDGEKVDCGYNWD